MASFKPHHAEDKSRHRNDHHHPKHRLEDKLKYKRGSKHKKHHSHTQNGPTGGVDANISDTDRLAITNHAVQTIQLFEARIAVIQEQHDSFETAYKKTCKDIETFRSECTDTTKLIERNVLFIKLINLALDHFIAVFLNAQALCDEFEESPGNAVLRLEMSLERYRQEFISMVAEYNSKQRELFRDLSAEALAKTEEQMMGKTSRVHMRSIGPDGRI